MVKVIIIDKEISKIVEKQFTRACKIIKTHKEKLDKLATKLLEKEVIFKDDLVKILGKRPFIEKNNTEISPKKNN